MFKRKQLTKLLIQSDRELIDHVVSVLEQKYRFETISPPGAGLAMLKMREHAKNSLFYIGEVVLMECRVRLGDTIGIGLVQGQNAYLAEQLAIVDAAYRANVPELMAMDELFLKWQARLDQQARDQWHRIEQTKVDFSTMEVADE